jgi:hypothetical protein
MNFHQQSITTGKPVVQLEKEYFERSLKQKALDIARKEALEKLFGKGTPQNGAINK